MFNDWVADVGVGPIWKVAQERRWRVANHTNASSRSILEAEAQDRVIRRWAIFILSILCNRVLLAILYRILQ